MKYQRILDRRKSLGLTQAGIARTVGVSKASVSLWEKGDTFPKGENLYALAKALKCEPSWILYGKDSPDFPSSNIEEGPEIQGKYPLISWVQAGDWTEMDEIEKLEAPRYVCPIKCSDDTFILTVRGMSMSPAFNEGELIFIDPKLEAENKSYVIARLDDENQATFKQLIIEGQHRFLKAANPVWPNPIIPIHGNCSIVGVVIFAGRSNFL